MRRFKYLSRYKYQLSAVLIFVVAAAVGLAIPDQKMPVRLAAQPPPPVTDTCSDNSIPYLEIYKCYTKELTSIINQQDAEQATAMLKAQYAANSYVKSNCHQLMHTVGRATYAKYGNLAEAFAHGDQYCWSGFYHGIMEQISKQKGYDYIIKNVNSICTPIADKYGLNSFYNYNCVHGLGHGFMEIQDEDLFKALDSCNQMKKDWNQTSCYGGVFMQNVMNVQGPDAQDPADYPYLKADQPMYPCTAVAGKYKGACYLMQTSYALQVENYDFSRVFQLCAKVESPYTDTCYQSLGRDASGQSVSDVTKTKNTCLLGTTAEAQTNCVIGAAKDFVSYFHSDQKGYELCRAVPADITQTCNDTVKQYYSNF